MPVAAPLRDLLDASPRPAKMILATTRGQLWPEDGFRTAWARACGRAGVKGLTFHDLRGTTVTRLALAGCTTIEIAAVTGHSPKDVDAILKAHYLGGHRSGGECVYSAQKADLGGNVSGGTGAKNLHTSLSDGRGSGPQHQKQFAAEIAQETGASLSREAEDGMPPRQCLGNRKRFESGTDQLRGGGIKGPPSGGKKW